jgi:hypothetical protein
MPLSPFAYYILQKLWQDLLRLPFLLIGQANLTHHNQSQTALSYLLRSLHDKDNAMSKVQELENLVRLYHSLASIHLSDQLSHQEIKCRILWLLGLNQALIATAKPPQIAPEKPGDAFNFYFEGHVRQGICHSGELYALIHEFPATYRVQAYRSVWALIDQNLPCLLTNSETRSGIWVSLRSPACPVLLKNGCILDTLLSLHSNACKLKQALISR